MESDAFDLRLSALARVNSVFFLIGVIRCLPCPGARRVSVVALSRSVFIRGKTLVFNFGNSGDSYHSSRAAMLVLVTFHAASCSV